MSLTPEQLSQWLPAVMDIADAAGREIMRIYQAGFSVTLKDDRSPRTEADLAAQRVIDAGLARLTPALPMLGEESAPEVFAQRRSWNTLWLVDPLDGTREFVKRNGEFSVNIALVEDGEPVLGVVSGPARSVMYAAARAGGAFRRGADGVCTRIHVRREPEEPLRVLGSRSFGDAKLDRKLEVLGPQVRISLGSALKFGLLAEGSGDLYVRRGPTSEWDTAAGHAVVLEAGGSVVDPSGRPLHYNVRDDVINPSFIAFGARTRDWVALLGGLQVARTPMHQRIDLHTHSSCSDGLLAPAALVDLAALRKVELLALTDHDTTFGCDEAASACDRHGIGFVPGVELTSLWRDREIHVIGLGIERSHAPFIAHCASVLALRRERIEAMGRRLTHAGLPGEELATEALSAAAPTRAHLARGLCARGLAATVQAAFDRWLKRGRPGYVAAQWPDLAGAVRCISDAAGVAVLAHPHRYPLSNGVLRELVGQFKAAGGVGLEVSLAGMGPGDADRAATLARRFDLAGSIGSDFHEPGLPWRPLGRFAKLPDRIMPITAHLGL